MTAASQVEGHDVGTAPKKSILVIPAEDPSDDKAANLRATYEKVWTEATKVTLNAPYRLQTGDTWIVTRQTGDDATAGQTVLRPT